MSVLKLGRTLIDGGGKIPWQVKGFRSKLGALIDKGYLYRVLRNRVYHGEAVHKGKAYPGEHEAIVTDKVWDQFDTILQGNRHARSFRR